MARPTIFTAALGAAICEKVAAGAYLAVAAKACGVGRSTLYEWIARGEAAADAADPLAAFADALKKAEAAAECASVAAVRAGAPGWQGSAWYLERKYPERYAADRRLKRAQIALAKTKALEGATLETLLRGASPDELRAILAKLRADRAGE